jgi:FKBP-type peptidyl-prolyl cis-trans isomerase
MLTARSLLMVLLASLSLVAFACGDDDEGDAGSTTPAAETGTEAAPPAETEAEEAPEAASGDLAKGISEDLEKKPSVKGGDGDPPAELQKIDVVEGDGKEAKEGDNVSVQYVGVNWSDGKQFDASWDRGGQPFEFTLGAGNVIQGWDQGLVGMKEGGRRLLVIPAELGYGPQGTPDGSIPPNETLKFVVDLEKVTSG